MVSEVLPIASTLQVPYLNSVKLHATARNIDYRLILALIKQESQFDHTALSNKGAYGLMQIVPSVASDVQNRLAIESIIHPNDNLRAGIYYFAKLFELFQNAHTYDRIALALAAYNAGPSRIYDAQELSAYLGLNPNSWSDVRESLPLLSKRYYSLHRALWGTDKPPCGYFRDWRQTIEYVEKVFRYYEEYLNRLPPQ
jgi:membrane-bound lytic murein transglycosylase F